MTVIKLILSGIISLRVCESGVFVVLVLRAGFDKGFEDPSLLLAVANHMLRMPLDTDAEGVRGMFDAFNDAVLTDGANEDVLADGGSCLMVQAVDTKCFPPHDLSQFRALRDGHGVITQILVGIIIVAAFGNVCNVLMERTAEIHIHQLLAATNAQNGLAGGEKCFQHLHFNFVTPRDDFTAFFSGGLAIEFWVHIFAAGQQQAVALEHFRNSLVQVIGVDPDRLCAGAVDGCGVFALHIFAEQILLEFRDRDGTIHDNSSGYCVGFIR